MQQIYRRTPHIFRTPLSKNTSVWLLLCEYSWQVISEVGQSYQKFVWEFRSIHQRCSVRKGVLRNFAKFTGKHLCQRLFPATILIKRLWNRCFTVNFANFRRTPFLQKTSGWLLLTFNRCNLKNLLYWWCHSIT